MAVIGIARAIARPVISSFVSQGLRPAAIVRNLRSMGISYRYQTILNDVREFTHFHKQWGWTKRISTSDVTDLDRIPAIDLPSAYNFRGYLDVTTKDYKTGIEEHTIKSFYSDDLLSQDQWIEEWLEGQVEDPSDPSVEIVSAVMTDVVKNSRLFR